MRLVGFGPADESDAFDYSGDPDNRAIARHVMEVVERWGRVRRMVRWTYDERTGTCDFAMLGCILLHEGYDGLLSDPRTMYDLVETTVMWGRKTFGEPQKINVG